MIENEIPLPDRMKIAISYLFKTKFLTKVHHEITISVAMIILGLFSFFEMYILCFEGHVLYAWKRELFM